MDYINKTRYTRIVNRRIMCINRKRLISLSLLAFLIVTLNVKFTTDTILSPFINLPLVFQIRDNFSQNANHNTKRFDASFLSKHQFLLDKIINPHNFEYLINPRMKCSGREVVLAICVSITKDNQAGRSVIRRTWGSYAKDPNNKAVLLFFVGSENKTSETESRLVRQSRLQEEASTFGDIVQENYIDSYRNLTLKSVSILRWVNSFCPKTKYILKVDDDIYVNIPLLMKVLQKFVLQSSPPSEFIIGYMLVKALVDRYPKSQWYIPYSVYSEETFPDYVSGPAYVMTSAAAILIYEASLRVVRVWVEDVYLTGICSKRARVQVYHSEHFTRYTPVASGCSFRNIVSGHKYTPEEIVKIHTELYDPQLTC